MPTLTLAVPEDLKKKMDELPEMNWSEIARKAISEKVQEYTLFKSIVKKSKLTEQDAIRMGREVNKALHERYRKAYKELK
jgi:predicted transcriptional regulator